MLERTKTQHMSAMTHEKAVREATEKRSELAEAEVAKLRQMVADLRLSKEEVEQQNIKLHTEHLEREIGLKQFFEKVTPALSGLGWPLRVSAAEAAATTESAAGQLNQVAAALADANVAKAYIQCSAVQSTGPGDLSAEEASVLGDAVWQAVEGGEALFEDWFSRQIDASARARLTKATRLLSGCRQAAALRNAVAASAPSGEEAPGFQPITAPLYVPSKTDPVDLLVASALLRLASDPACSTGIATTTAGLLRLEQGKYRLGVDGQTITCYATMGRVMVQMPVGNSNEAHAEPMELSEFLRSSTARDIPKKGLPS